MIRDIVRDKRLLLGGALIAGLGIYLILGNQRPEEGGSARSVGAQGQETVKEAKLEALTAENFREKIKNSSSALVMWYHSSFDKKAPFLNEDGRQYMEQLRRDLGDQPIRCYLLDMAKLKKPWETLRKETKDVFHPCFVLYINNQIVKVIPGSPQKDKWEEGIANDKEFILKVLREKMVGK
jgi:hypothetical protein